MLPEHIHIFLSPIPSLAVADGFLESREVFSLYIHFLMKHLTSQLTLWTQAYKKLVMFQQRENKVP